MLHTGAISKPTLELLKQLMADENLSNFKLAGGTALALQIGRKWPTRFALNKLPNAN
ncbi:MAG: hypothetical protein ACJAT1_000073 [Marivirga sp.]|jgi:hypothetical protein